MIWHEVFKDTSSGSAEVAAASLTFEISLIATVEIVKKIYMYIDIARHM